MLIYEPTERISAREASQHVYLTARFLKKWGSSAFPVQKPLNIVSSELNYPSSSAEQNNVQGSNMDIEVSDGKAHTENTDAANLTDNRDEDSTNFNHNQSNILRIIKDYASLHEYLPGWVREIDLIDDDITKWRVVIKCLDHAGPLKDAILEINLIFGIDYPYKQPVVKFIHQIFHPNIDFTTGVLCTDGKWAVIYDVEMLLFTIRNLLTYPSISIDGSENPVNIEAAALYSNEPETYSEICRKVLDEKNPNLFLLFDDNYLSPSSEQNNVQGSNMDTEVSDGVSRKRLRLFEWGNTTSERLPYIIYIHFIYQIYSIYYSYLF